MSGGFADWILEHRGDPEDRPGALERAMLAVDKPDEPYDDDERQAALLARGYSPGLVYELSERLRDAEADLAAEEKKIADGERRAKHVMRMHENGQIRAFDIPAALGDEGDPGKVAQLERQCRDLQRRLSDAQSTIAPPQERQLDGVAEAGRHAHRVFTEVTRAKMAAAEAGRPGPRPFASRGAAVPGEPVACPACIAIGATEAESFAIHHSDADGNPLAVPETELAESGGQEAGRYQPVAYR